MSPSEESTEQPFFSPVSSPQHTTLSALLAFPPLAMAMNGVSWPIIDAISLPNVSEAEVDFQDSSFFQSNGAVRAQLPTPLSVLQQLPNRGPGVVKFEDLHLAVKFGDSDWVRFEEAQTMRAVRQAFPVNDIPIPEVFAWRKHGDMNFIYMSLIPGQTLEQAWESLNEADKASVCDDLGRIVRTLRRSRPNSPSRFIGMILCLPSCSYSDKR